MYAVQGYYDGETIQIPDKIMAKKGQKVVVTVLDEFVKAHDETVQDTPGGSLSRYANPKLREAEEGAWEREVVKKYGSA